MKESNVPPGEESPSDHAQLIKEFDDGTKKIINGIKKVYNSLSLPSPKKEKARKHLSTAWKHLNLARKLAKDKKSGSECFRIFAVEFKKTNTELDETRKIFHAPKLKQERERMEALWKKIPEEYRKNITNGGCL